MFLLRHLQAFIPVVDFALPLPLCFLGGRAAFHRLCAKIMEHARLALLTQAITFSSNVHRRGVMQQAVEHGSRQDRVLECVIMPFSLIVLLVEAILGAV